MSVHISGEESKACCTLPPVQNEAEYKPLGSWSEFNGLKTYFSGPEDAKAAVLIIYDIFGISPQIIQGADLLASQGFRVVMPDFFKGEPAQAPWYNGSEEGQKLRDAWSAGTGSIAKQITPIGKVALALKGKYSKLGAAGYCWGYKAMVLSVPEGGKEFDALAGIHPSRSAEDDVEKITKPLLLLPSNGEDMTMMNKIYTAVEAKNPGKNKIREFPDSLHGWMAARGDTTSEKGKKEFHEGYTELANFFKEVLV